MGRTNYSNVGKDPYLRKRWYDKVNFSQFEYTSYSAAEAGRGVSTGMFSSDSGVSKGITYSGLGHRDKPVETSSKGQSVRNFDEQVEKTCCNQD